MVRRTVRWQSTWQLGQRIIIRNAACPFPVLYLATLQWLVAFLFVCFVVPSALFYVSFHSWFSAHTFSHVYAMFPQIVLRHTCILAATSLTAFVKIIFSETLPAVGGASHTGDGNCFFAFSSSQNQVGYHFLKDNVCIIRLIRIIMSLQVYKFRGKLHW